MTSESPNVGVPKQDSEIESEPKQDLPQTRPGSAQMRLFTNSLRMDKNKSEIAVAIAVDNREEFNTKYRNIIEEKAEEYGFLQKDPS